MSPSILVIGLVTVLIGTPTSGKICLRCFCKFQLGKVNLAYLQKNSAIIM